MIDRWMSPVYRTFVSECEGPSPRHRGELRSRYESCVVCETLALMSTHSHCTHGMRFTLLDTKNEKGRPPELMASCLNGLGCT